ncbi:MAG: DsbA family protein, partial [Candidatus Binataceae bacterium]
DKEHGSVRISCFRRGLGAIVFFAALLALGPYGGVARAASAGDTHGNSGKAASGNMPIQLFLQRRFRLPSASDVEVGPQKASPIPGLSSRIVKVHNESGQSATFVVYTDASGKTAILSDVEIGPATPGPLHGLWSRPLRPASQAPGAPAKSMLITDSPGKAILGTKLDLSKDPWGRINLDKLHLNDRATLGPDDAPVTIIEFGDLECPFCARAFSEIETVVNTTHKGKVRLIFKHFPLNIHPWAMQGAIAAECVRRQNPKAFWSFVNDIYRDQGAINPQNLRDHVNTYVGQLGLDQEALNACIMAPAAEAQVRQDRDDGTAIGVNSTPTFLVNGIELVGLPSDKSFEYVVSSELKKQHQASR